MQTVNSFIKKNNNIIGLRFSGSLLDFPGFCKGGRTPSVSSTTPSPFDPTLLNIFVIFMIYNNWLMFDEFLFEFIRTGISSII